MKRNSSPWEQKTSKNQQHGATWCSKVLLWIALLLAATGSVHLSAQCCLTTSVTISTGYDPVSRTVIAPSANGTPMGTFHRDPKWVVTGISPAASAAILAMP